MIKHEDAHNQKTHENANRPLEACTLILSLTPHSATGIHLRPLFSSLACSLLSSSGSISLKRRLRLDVRRARRHWGTSLLLHRLVELARRTMQMMLTNQARAAADLVNIRRVEAPRKLPRT